MSALRPPHIITSDPGAHNLTPTTPPSTTSHSRSSSSGSFASAPSGTASPAPPASPIPSLRVEKLSPDPSHGEIPGTHAYDLRTADAVPDEVEIVPEGARSRASTLQAPSTPIGGGGAGWGRERSVSRPKSPGGTVIPRTVVERVDDRPAHGEVEGTLAKELRGADAEPDELVVVGDVETEGRDKGGVRESGGGQEWLRRMWSEEKQQGGERELPLVGGRAEADADGEDDGDDDDETQHEENGNDFGDDFDDFADGDEGDFGDFDEPDTTEPTTPPQPPADQAPVPADPFYGLPPLNLSSLTPLETHTALEPYMHFLFPPKSTSSPSPPAQPHPPPAFLTPRAQSLWHQLSSPPPLTPPNWTRSKIRRLFLVSLGVPVDLDEVLPPSNQKRLVLPNINLARSPRASGTVERLKAGSTNDSTASLGSSGRKAGGGRKKEAEPEFDLNALTLLASTTEARLGGMEDGELVAHVDLIKGFLNEGQVAVKFWEGKVEEGRREKEALEGVIERVVGFVKGRRGGR